jgi:uncharacterized protein involved in copper resistance
VVQTQNGVIASDNGKSKLGGHFTAKARFTATWFGRDTGRLWLRSMIENVAGQRYFSNTFPTSHSSSTALYLTHKIP